MQGGVNMNNVLVVDKLQTAFNTEKGEVVSVDEVSFQLASGETIAIVGESGCGKSVTSLSIMKLLGSKGFIKSGSIELEGMDLTNLPEKYMKEVRGRLISIIFQDPMTSLNPVYTIGNQLSEPLIKHLKYTKREAWKVAEGLLKKVGIPRAEDIMKSYPHALSGGMKQRVMIAMALSCNPKVLIADEPTTALDVTIQAQILNLLKELKEQFNTSIIFITHDLGVVADIADRVIVMYAGQVVEETDVFTLFENPQHPYTKGLMESIPHLELDGAEKLNTIEGSVPSLTNMLPGCRYHNRCPYATEACKVEQPKLIEVAEGHRVRCLLAN
jgi:peptide/nickel transport system ATP-binding protein